MTDRMDALMKRLEVFSQRRKKAIEATERFLAHPMQGIEVEFAEICIELTQIKIQIEELRELILKQ